MNPMAGFNCFGRRFSCRLVVNTDSIDSEQRRQGGYGRGGRQRIGTDTVTFLSGLGKVRLLEAPHVTGN